MAGFGRRGGGGAPLRASRAESLANGAVNTAPLLPDLFQCAPTRASARRGGGLHGAGWRGQCGAGSFEGRGVARRAPGLEYPRPRNGNYRCWVKSRAFIVRQCVGSLGWARQGRCDAQAAWHGMCSQADHCSCGVIHCRDRPASAAPPGGLPWLPLSAAGPCA